ncbi:proline and serine-rich protein 2 [Ochotona princeps]|uniref:proline and serine-rich protein 2 n=1 Tax=Ochotona princeps TaxID=9978 RepID=UPI0027153B51|nr:proline and serine-rich protein 2 [Ochotona princeps]XP_058525460.1 proline and serine-rich protein 2 [Ochotona princeps]
MPVGQQKPDSPEMDTDLAPSCGLSDCSRGGSLESRSSSSRSRSFTLDDESLKYLTHEEKDVILFFEETLDSLEDDFEEPAQCDSGIHCHSPQSLEESTSSHSEPEDVIDLVPPGPAAGEAECLPDVAQLAGAAPVGKEDTPTTLSECGKPEAESSRPLDPTAPDALPPPPSLPSMEAPTSQRKETLSPPPAEHPKLARSVPTPLVIAQKISEKLAGGEASSPTSPSKEARPGEWRTPTPPAPRSGEPSLWHRHSAQPAAKVHRFPSNISVTNSAGKEFNKTISKAAVNVQERKAQVLANINGVSFLAASAAHREDQKNEFAGEQGRNVPAGAAAPERSRAGTAEAPRAAQTGRQHSRGVQTERGPLPASGFQSIHDVLRSEPSPFVSTGKTVTFRPDPAVTSSKLARQNASKSFYTHRQQPEDGGGPPADTRRRAGSLPRAVGFRPQGITVQFSGRGSTEEARREALRKLGLLKENL